MAGAVPAHNLPSRRFSSVGRDETMEEPLEAQEARDAWCVSRSKLQELLQGRLGQSKLRIRGGSDVDIIGLNGNGMSVQPEDLREATWWQHAAATKTDGHKWK